jgi:P27 family predicted phage terminase small subunit
MPAYKKPTELKLTNQPCRKIPNQPKVPLGSPPKPNHLNVQEQKLWAEVVDVINQVGVLAVTDGFAIELLVVSYADFRRVSSALESLEANPDSDPKKKKELFGQKRELVKEIKSLISLFGMSPADRSRVSATPNVDEDDNILSIYGSN